MNPRQRRGLFLILLALVGAVLTYTSIVQYTRSVAAQLGPRQDVVIVKGDIRAYEPIDAGRLDVMSVPLVFLPAGALETPSEVKGRVSPLDLPEGTLLQSSSLMEPPALGYGERAVSINADLETSVGESLQQNDTVVVTAAYRSGSEATSSVVIEAARVLSSRRIEEGDPQRLVTLALDRDQMLALTRARAGAETIVVGRYPAIERALQETNR